MRHLSLPEDATLTSVDYLMFADIDHAHPEAAGDIKDWGVWILNETGAAGFRL